MPLFVLLYGFNDSFEGFRVIYGEFSENFTVEGDTLFLESGNKLGIRKTEFARSVVDTGNPEGAKVAFFITTVAVSVAEGFDNALFREAKTTGTIMLHPLRSREGFLVFGVGGDAAFNSHD